MRQAFERHLLPRLLKLKRAPATIDEYRRTIKAWERPRENRIINPILPAITDQMLDGWIDGLAEEGYAAKTIVKHRVNLLAILRACGPRSDRNPHGAKLLAEVPACLPVTVEDCDVRPSRFVYDDEVTSLYHDCRVLSSPLLAAKFQAFIVIERTYGPRTRDGFGLRWSENIIDAPQHPDPACRGERSPFGWMRYVAKKTGVLVTVPITSAARVHLERIRTDSEFVFPATWLRSAAKCFYARWARITAATREKFRSQRCELLPAEDCDPRDLRATAETLWDKCDPALGRFVLGHRGGSIAEKHYQKTVTIMMERLYPPSPDDPRRWQELPAFVSGQQKLLF